MVFHKRVVLSHVLLIRKEGMELQKITQVLIFLIRPPEVF